MSKKEIKCLMFGTDAQGGIQTVIRLYKQSGLFDELGILYVPSHIETSVWGRAWVFTKAILIMLYYFVFGDVKLVHLHAAAKGSFWRKAVLICISKLFRKKVIFHLHGSEFKDFYELLLTSYWRDVVTRIINLTDTVMVLSSQWKNWIQDQAGVTTNVVVVQNFVNPVAINVANRLTQPTFLFLGRVGERKGTFDLLNAFAKVQEQINCQLWIAGDGELERAQQTIITLGLENSVTLHGWVGPDKIRVLLEQSNVYVLPSYNEGQPMSIAEAMSARLPVVSTTIGGIPDQVTDGVEGYLVSAGDVPALADKMVLLAKDADLRKKMGKQAGVKFAENFSPDVCLPLIRDIYQQLSEQ